MDQAVRVSARLCGGAGYFDLTGLGIRAIPSSGRTRYHNLLSRRATHNSPTSTRRTRAGRSPAVSFVLLPVSDLQASVDLVRMEDFAEDLPFAVEFEQREKVGEAMTTPVFELEANGGDGLDEVDAGDTAL